MGSFESGNGTFSPPGIGSGEAEDFNSGNGIDGENSGDRENGGGESGGGSNGDSGSKRVRGGRNYIPKYGRDPVTGAALGPDGLPRSAGRQKDYPGGTVRNQGNGSGSAGNRDQAREEANIPPSQRGKKKPAAPQTPGNLLGDIERISRLVFNKLGHPELTFEREELEEIAGAYKNFAAAWFPNADDFVLPPKLTSAVALISVMYAAVDSRIALFNGIKVSSVKVAKKPKPAEPEKEEPEPEESEPPIPQHFAAFD